MIPVLALLLATPPKLDLEQTLRFLKAIKPVSTLTEVKKVAGKGVTFSKPTWTPPVDGALPGFVVKLSGSVQGEVSFLNKAQRQLLLKGKPGGKWDDQLPIFGVLLTVEASKTHSKSGSRALIDRIAKSLGKPTIRPDYTDEWANDFGGWTTTFRVAGRDVGFYQCNFGEVESRLELVFQQPLY